MLRELYDDDGRCRVERREDEDGEDVWEEGRGKEVGVGREREGWIEREGAGTRGGGVREG